ncbi:MAG: serine hydrolase domain-containing protein [Bacteroidales bacterium]|nr:serine hydrolase [Bacteroidales bacterium]MDD4657124.1 serine hydrolase [Bacteroidales bacterium]
MRKFIGTILLFGFVAIMPLFAQDNEAILKNTTDYLQEVKAQWKIPGMAFAVVKDGEMIYSNGFGVKELGKSDPVDASTLFQIGSVSKSFTAAVMASLVEEEKVNWNDTVKNILPDFRMYDKWVEENLQVKDIMTHHSGLQGQLGTYIPNMGYEREDIYNMLPLLKPKYSLRGSYEYNNITFIIASKIIEKVTGKSWEDNVRERIFKPLGMANSRVTGDEFASFKNVATPHSFSYLKGAALTDSTWVDSISVTPLIGSDAQALHWLSVIGPAGSISSTVEDMSKYLLFHLNKGMVDSKQVVAKKQMEYLRKGHTIVSQDSAKTTLYAHCWFVEQNSRYRLYFHTGTTWGFTTLTAFVPELDLGFVILVNSEAPALPRYALMRRIVELYKGYPDKDYNAKYYKEWLEDKRASQKKRDKKAAEVEKLPAPNLNKLVGVYDKGELFGKAVIEMENNELFITVGPKDWRSKLIHVNGNEFKFRMGGTTFETEFEFDKDGRICVGLDMQYGYTENFGIWPKIK